MAKPKAANDAVRKPSSPEQRWAWWEAAINGEALPIHDGEPQAGFYAVRKFRYGEWTNGPLIPARIWWQGGEIDPDTGELISDEICRAEIDGKRIDPWVNWTWLAKRPIREEEWQWLTAMSPLLPSKIPRRNRS